MILMPQIFDVTANENARYKSNELEFSIDLRFDCIFKIPFVWLNLMTDENSNNRQNI